MIIPRMVINMDESRLCTIEQIEQFLSASTLVEFSKYGDNVDRYEHISRVLKRFDPLEEQKTVKTTQPCTVNL